MIFNPDLKDNMNKCKFIFLLIAVVSLLLSCGSRGDPVAVPKYDEKPAAASAVQNSNEVIAPVKDEIPEKQIPPEAPKGLAGVYTGRNIVLVWDDVTVEGLKGYNIYRSAGNEYEMIAYSFVPAYTDNEIKDGTTYYYKVTALGVVEGTYSKVVKIKTERR